MKRLLVVCNANASQDGTDIDDALNALRDSGIDVRVQPTERIADLHKAIHAAADKVDAVVVSGGDGSINAALQPLLDTGLPFGVVPLGTANDFARTLGIPDDPYAACSIIGAGAIRTIDVGMANERPFVNAAGIGMSTRIARRLTKSGKRSLGALSYPVAVVGTMRDHRPFRAIIESDDGRQELRSIQITVGNGVYYGGGTPIAADAAIDDGRLDLYSVQPQPLGRMIGVALAVRRGTQAHLPEGVHTASGTAFSVTTRRPLRVALDGEPLLRTPVQFRVVRRALRVIAPAAPPPIPAD